MARYMISEVARRFDIPPRLLTDWFYRRELSDTACPIVSGRRMIPEGYLPEIEKLIRRKGISHEVSHAQ